jgi:hypothetical protein
LGVTRLQVLDKPQIDDILVALVAPRGPCPAASRFRFPAKMR